MKKKVNFSLKDILMISYSWKTLLNTFPPFLTSSFHTLPFRAKFCFSLRSVFISETRVPVQLSGNVSKKTMMHKLWEMYSLHMSVKWLWPPLVLGCRISGGEKSSLQPGLGSHQEPVFVLPGSSLLWCRLPKIAPDSLHKMDLEVPPLLRSKDNMVSWWIHHISLTCSGLHKHCVGYQRSPWLLNG